MSLAFEFIAIIILASIAVIESTNHIVTARERNDLQIFLINRKLGEYFRDFRGIRHFRTLDKPKDIQE